MVRPVRAVDDGSGREVILRLRAPHELDVEPEVVRTGFARRIFVAHVIEAQAQRRGQLVEQIVAQVGDRFLERLRAARSDFTPEGWREFMKRLDGWLDAKGAPTFSSSFVPFGDPTIVSRRDGVLHVTIPGTLKHSQNGSSTTYRVVVEVRAVGKPMKIEHLKQTMCGGPPAPPCQ